MEGVGGSSPLSPTTLLKQNSTKGAPHSLGEVGRILKPPRSSEVNSYGCPLYSLNTMPTVYILRSQSHPDQRYIGLTNDLNARPPFLILHS